MPAVKPQPKAASQGAKSSQTTHTKKVAQVRVRKSDGTIKTITAKKAPAKVAVKASGKNRLSALDGFTVVVLKAKSFGRGLATFDVGGIGVPKALKGQKATDAVRAAGITTPTGNLTKRYR